MKTQTKHTPNCTHDEDKCSLCKTAPELLNVCKELLEAFIENQNDLNEIPISQAMLLLKKVIKKAEGA